MNVRWRWGTRRAGAFFIPTLDPFTTTAEALRTADKARRRITTQTCIYKGMLGVLITVKR